MADITVKFITLGCKTNIYESEAMAELFKEKGYEVISNDDTPADICVINTCTVTGIGAKKSRQQIRRAKRLNPNAVIAVTGCFAQTEPDAVKEIGADIIIGSSGKSRIAELSEAALSGRRIGIVGDILSEHEYEELPITRTQSRIRANIKIEDGCDNFCTYCVIPYARGPVRSRDIKNIIAEATTLAEHGYTEIVLTGIHIGSYGKDIGYRHTLMDVIEALDEIDGIERIRLGSIEPVIITEDFVSRAAKLKHLCPQFHLSLQSGSEATLKRMNRHYTPSEYRSAINMLRGSIADASITTDLMVGFSGETNAEFDESYEFCKSIGFMQMHIFKYSVRRGTYAETLDGRVDERTKELRSRKMLELGEYMKREFYESYYGKPIKVLLEQQNENGFYHGTTPNYMNILVKAESGMEGKAIIAVPEKYENGFLYANRKGE